MKPSVTISSAVTTWSWEYMLAGLSEYTTIGAPNVTVPPPAAPLL